MSEKPKNIELHQVTDPNSEEFRRFWEIYVEAFPPEQRRPKVAQKNCMTKSQFSLQAIMNQGVMVGFLSDWDLGNFIYIEHLATINNLRGKGMGSKALSFFLHSQTKLVVLESDPPDQADRISIRRLAFYERVGLVKNPQRIYPIPICQWAARLACRSTFLPNGNFKQ